MSVLLRVQRGLLEGRVSTPALFTGTSSEFLGRRALPRMLRDRPVVMVLGPSGSGKTSVARRLCNQRELYVDTPQLQEALLVRVRSTRWGLDLLNAHALVLDGPHYLRHRPEACRFLRELFRQRAASGRRTIVVQPDSDGSVDALIREMEPGSMVTLGLRFPKGQRGRLRFARRICDHLGLSRVEARGTDLIEPWGYAAVIEHLASLKTG